MRVYIKELKKEVPMTLRHFARYLSLRFNASFIDIITEDKYQEARYAFWLVGKDILRFTPSELAFKTHRKKQNIINQLSRAKSMYIDNPSFKSLVDDIIGSVRNGITIDIDGEVYEEAYPRRD